MYDADTDTSEPSLVDSVIRIFEAGQRVVLDRLDLARFDLSQLATRASRGTALVAVGALLLTGAWFTLLGGAVVWLEQYRSLPVSLAAVAVVSAALGGAAIALGVRRTRPGGDFGVAGSLVESVRAVSGAANEGREAGGNE